MCFKSEHVLLVRTCDVFEIAYFFGYFKWVALSVFLHLVGIKLD